MRRGRATRAADARRVRHRRRVRRVHLSRVRRCPRNVGRNCHRGSRDAWEIDLAWWDSQAREGDSAAISISRAELALPRKAEFRYRDGEAALQFPPVKTNA